LRVSETSRRSLRTLGQINGPLKVFPGTTVKLTS
jgi:hypothetical protein